MKDRLLVASSLGSFSVGGRRKESLVTAACTFSASPYQQNMIS